MLFVIYYLKVYMINYESIKFNERTFDSCENDGQSFQIILSELE